MPLLHSVLGRHTLHKHTPSTAELLSKCLPRCPYACPKTTTQCAAFSSRLFNNSDIQRLSLPVVTEHDMGRTIPGMASTSQGLPCARVSPFWNERWPRKPRSRLCTGCDPLGRPRGCSYSLPFPHDASSDPTFSLSSRQSAIPASEWLSPS